MKTTRVVCASDRPVERASILLAAMDSIVGRGYDGLAAGAVAEEAGVDIDTVRAHFPTTALLAEAVLNYISAQLVQTIYVELPPDDRLRLHIAELRVAIDQRPAMFVVLAELESRSRRDQVIRAAIARAQQQWRDAVREVVREGKRSGVWPCEFDEEAMIDLLIGAAVNVRFQSATAARMLDQLERFVFPSS